MTRRLLPLILFPALVNAAAVDPLRFEKEVLVAGCSDPMQLDIAPDGRVFFCERAGAVKMWLPDTRRTVTIGTYPSLTSGDAGALGLALAGDFAASGRMYLFRIPLNEPRKIVIARFTLRGEKLEDEKRVLEVGLGAGPVQSHNGGGLAWDSAGNLLIGIGDNMPPQDVPAVHAADASRDARGTAANSQELRGKILRITPQADGSYSIPQGNAFTDAATGRPEVYAWGVRNPFRLAWDATTGLLAWGDVGGNVKTSLNLGPEGFDEVNVAPGPGFFGWPFGSGPNAPWRPFNPATNAPEGTFFDMEHPVNESKANTGLKALPASRPAAIYYSGATQPEWPWAGSGGRSVTGGVFYRPADGDGERRLPDEWRGAYLFGEWMRNWVALARFSADGKLEKAEPVLSHLKFRRPVDFKIGPEGALYIAECGDRWTGNTDSEITRIIYRRGNRPPLAVAEASNVSGRTPLKVKFDAGRSSDPDNDGALRFAWDFGGGKTAEGVKAEWTFSDAGVWPVTLTVTDAQGATTVAALQVMAGNEAPRVAFTAPLDGGFFDYRRPVEWKLEASDAEDGALPAEKLLVQMETRNRAAADDVIAPPGLALMRRTTCFACHSTAEKSAGPPYATVAARYAADPGARAKLAAKIIAGGQGVWGELPMPPHPQHTPAEAAMMVDWVLSLASRRIATLPAGTGGQVEVPEPKREWGRAENSVISLTASAVDNGAGPVPPQRSSTEIILRARRQRASFFDRGHRAATQDNLDQGGIVARVEAGGWIAFDRIRLSQTGGLKLHAWPQGSAPLRLAVRVEGGESLATTEVAPGSGGGKPREIALPFDAPRADGPPVPLVIQVDGAPGDFLEVMWVEFIK